MKIGALIEKEDRYLISSKIFVLSDMQWLMHVTHYMNQIGQGYIFFNCLQFSTFVEQGNYHQGHPKMTQNNPNIKVNIEIPTSLLINSIRAIALLALTLVIGSNSPKLMDPAINEPPGPIPQIIH